VFTKILIVVAIVAICLAVYGLLAGINGWWPLGTGGAGGYQNGTSAESNQPNDAPRNPESYTVEIREGTIIYMQNEVTLDELEEILERYQHLDEVWILTDAFRAYSVTFESVRALFRLHDIVFAEN